MTYNNLNDIVLVTSEQIEHASGRELSNTEKYSLNDKISEFLQEVQIDVTEES
jgi:hypothetical protein